MARHSETPAYRIVIPSYKRADSLLVTLRSIPRSLISRTVILVHPSELRKYKKNPEIYERGFKIMTTRLQGQLSNVRHWIFKTLSKKLEVSCIITLDDDLYFYKRNKKMKLSKVSEVEARQMFDYVARLTMQDGYGACGISARQGNNRVEPMVVENSRMMTGYAVNCNVYIKEKIDIRKIPLKQDFYLTLRMLTKGYKNRVVFNYCWNQSGNNTSGGCSEYRTEKLMRESADYLQSQFPDFVKVVKKRSKSWKGMEERTDVTIQWKRAFLSSLH